MTLDRRALLKAACGGCAALGFAACGGSSTPKAAAPTTADGVPTTGGSTPTAAAPKATASAAIAKLAAIPVGGSAAAKSPEGDPLLLARPTASTVVGFSAICTHQGCTVEPAGKHFGCPCHDSVYDAFTGEVLSGPAPSRLHSFAVRIEGDSVVAA